jgi:signal transduction histidine kinase
MDPLRDLLARKRAELQDRWERQLRAAAEGGFPLDAHTAQILPQLLQSASAALERRFRLPKPGAGPVEIAARTAAVQASLLCDFVYDTALEGTELSMAETRRLADALAHAAVEVQVKTALDASLEGRRVKLDRVLAEASDETAPEAQERGVNLLFAAAGKVEMSGDPRVLRTGVRAFVRAAVDLSRRGATVELDCARRHEAARIAAVIDRCRRRPAGVLNGLGGLGLVRRAARAHGGEVRVRGRSGEGCTLTFDVPVAPP